MMSYKCSDGILVTAQALGQHVHVRFGHVKVDIDGFLTSKCLQSEKWSATSYDIVGYLLQKYSEIRIS